jgi:cytochrome o ubiquinol oxidase subunit III
MEKEHAADHSIKDFGFWVYLMTDLVIFAVLFATFIVLRNNTFHGPSGRELFEMPTVIAETLLLLTSSFTCALGMIAVYRKQKKRAIFWYALTFILGASFLYLEIIEFHQFASEGNSWQRSAFLSSFFTLVGTHGLHITCGLLWMLVSMCQIGLRPLTAHPTSRILRMSLFWHFLDFVWIFIFTIVYGMSHLL